MKIENWDTIKQTQEMSEWREQLQLQQQPQMILIKATVTRNSGRQFFILNSYIWMI